MLLHYLLILYSHSEKDYNIKYLECIIKQVNPFRVDCGKQKGWINTGLKYNNIWLGDNKVLDTLDFITKSDPYCGKLSYGYELYNEIESISHTIKDSCKTFPKIQMKDKWRLKRFGINNIDIRYKIRHAMVLKWIKIVRKQMLLYDNELISVKEVLSLLKDMYGKIVIDPFKYFVRDVCECRKMHHDPNFDSHIKFNTNIMKLEARRCMMESMINYVHNYK